MNTYNFLIIYVLISFPSLAMNRAREVEPCKEICEAAKVNNDESYDSSSEEWMENFTKLNRNPVYLKLKANTFIKNIPKSDIDKFNKLEAIDIGMYEIAVSNNGTPIASEGFSACVAFGMTGKDADGKNVLVLAHAPEVEALEVILRIIEQNEFFKIDPSTMKTYLIGLTLEELASVENYLKLLIGWNLSGALFSPLGENWNYPVDVILTPMGMFWIDSRSLSLPLSKKYKEYNLRWGFDKMMYHKPEPSLVPEQGRSGWWDKDSENRRHKEGLLSMTDLFQ